MTQEILPVHQPSPVPQLLYSCKQHKDAFFYSMMALAVLLLLGSTILIAVLQVWVSLIIMVLTSGIVFGIVFLCIPKRLEVWSDSVKIVFIPGYKWSLTLASILSVEENPEICSITPGVKFSTSLSRNIRIYRRGLAVKLSPEHPVEFCQQIRYAMSPGSYILPTKTI